VPEDSAAQEGVLVRGVNVGSEYADAVIGAKDMSVDGEKQDGTKQPIMRDGYWLI
jgi:leucyl aminopeptidase (aminopeptidase T)